MLLPLRSRFRPVRPCATPQMAAHQAPPSLGFSRQEHWSGLPFPSPMHESEKSKWSRSVVSDSLWPHGLQPTRLLHPWDFSRQESWSGVPLRELTRREPPEYKTQHHPATRSTLCSTPHLNGKQSKNTNPTISRQDDPSLSLALQRKNKQTNKNSAQRSPYRKLTQTTEPTLRGQKPKEERIQPSSRKEFNFPLSLGKGMKRQWNTAQMKEKTRNTEVQVNKRK